MQSIYTLYTKPITLLCICGTSALFAIDSQHEKSLQTTHAVSTMPPYHETLQTPIQDTETTGKKHTNKRSSISNDPVRSGALQTLKADDDIYHAKTQILNSKMGHDFNLEDHDGSITSLCQQITKQYDKKLQEKRYSVRVEKDETIKHLSALVYHYKNQWKPAACIGGLTGILATLFVQSQYALTLSHITARMPAMPSCISRFNTYLSDIFSTGTTKIASLCSWFTRST